MYDTSTHSMPSGITSWPRRAERWLDERGKGAWIAAMVLGFIFVWPVGLAILAYMIWSNRMFNRSACRSRRHSHDTWKTASTGNAAFDAYRTETIRRLEDEQEAFEAFLKRLRDAKDKQEFDAFMEERVKSNKAEDAAKDVSAY